MSELVKGAIIEIHLPPTLTSRGKLICPVCGEGNWGGDWWWRNHSKKRHVQCSVDGCDRWFASTAGLSQHKRMAHARALP